MQVLQKHLLLTTLLFRSADRVVRTEIVSGLHLQCLLEDSNCASDPASMRISVDLMMKEHVSFTCLRV